MKFRAWIVVSLVACSIVAAWAAPSTSSQIITPDSKAFGNSLSGWLSIYWRWYYTGADLTQSQVGRVQLLPLPNEEQKGGIGTPEDPLLLVGQMEITLAAGTPFVLPLFAWVGERYETGPDDQPFTDSVLLAGVRPQLTIDGELVVSETNRADYYVPQTFFDPIVIYPAPTSYGAIAALWFQGYGVVSVPLKVGTHVVHLYEPCILPSNALSIIYDNTWIITVSAK